VPVWNVLQRTFGTFVLQARSYIILCYFICVYTMYSMYSILYNRYAFYVPYTYNSDPVTSHLNYQYYQYTGRRRSCSSCRGRCSTPMRPSS
ncbi:hypothetical protein B484DRAFT_453101, partial [Ochromonadaceae sp. CCMP2298]